MANQKNQYKSSQFTLKPEQVEILLNASQNLRDKLIIGSLYFPALRRFEVAKMKVEDIDADNGRITVIGKGNKIAIIPVGSVYPQYINDIKYYLQFIKIKSGYIFGINKPLCNSRINQILHKTAQKCKLKHPNPETINRYNVSKKNIAVLKRQVNPHLLRHSQARHLKDQGFTAEYIKNYLRHESIQTTMDTYGTLGLDEMEQIARNKKYSTTTATMIK